VQKTPTCWLWTGNKNDWGYGHFWYEGKMVKAHRWAYEQENGPVPSGKVLMHSCDVPNCVNPAHISAGTLSDNSQDSLKKGRNKLAKLKVEQVKAIAERLRGKPVNWKTYGPIAKEFGVQDNVIYFLHVGRCWTKITGLPRMKLGGITDFEPVTCSADRDRKPTE
jgi:hypothetical protein